LALALVVPEATALPMLVQPAVTLAAKAETLRSAQSPQLMAVAVAVLVQALLHSAPVAPEQVSAQRVQALALLGATVVAAVALPVQPQVSVL